MMTGKILKNGKDAAGVPLGLFFFKQETIFPCVTSSQKQLNQFSKQAVESRAECILPYNRADTFVYVKQDMFA